MKSIKLEPIELLLNKFGIDISKIDQISTGLKYSAVMLKNGNIGVCANLKSQISLTKNDLQNPNIDNLPHRILLTAYYNALLNYSNIYKKNADIFNIVDFKKYKKIIMVGFFQPIIEKFQRSKIPLSIFDLKKHDSLLTPLSEQKKYLKKTDAIILTSTSIFNKTFMNLLENASKNCDIFILGPSSIMHPKILEYKNIKVIFGAIFKKYDERVLKTIQNGYGTRKFLKYGKKVFLKKKKPRIFTNAHK